mmetsp:Transcript_116046/g.248136  ORF Transcript_116046/g.248136 Transcript_116046/m.248136 type:complete len:125 (+) Transcript_116046:116-490(+)
MAAKGVKEMGAAAPSSAKLPTPLRSRRSRPTMTSLDIGHAVADAAAAARERRDALGSATGITRRERDDGCNFVESLGLLVGLCAQALGATSDAGLQRYAVSKQAESASLAIAPGTRQRGRTLSK